MANKPEKSSPETPEPPNKVQLLAPTYYMRKEIQKAMFQFCKHRETTANFNNKFFAKRPDCFDYPNDIANAAKQGATSFHCSEEIWEDPLKINTDMTPQQYNEIKIGWDFLIDIDSKYLDHAKIAARLLIKTLESHGIKNIGIKFSGSKGFHIIVPFKSFPEEMYGQKTKNNFPEWPRAIAGYIGELIKNPMNEEILNLTDREKLKEKGELTSQHICPNCKKPTLEKKIGIYKCPNFQCRSVVKSMKSNRKQMLCPSCNDKMNRVSEELVYICEPCKMNSSQIDAKRLRNDSSPYVKTRVENQKIVDDVIQSEDTIQSTVDSVDIVLVASRHLFRAPYSLHEKTAFASIVINKEDIENFSPSDADPLKITQTKSFMPDVEPEEGKELLAHALEWAKKDEPVKTEKKYTGEKMDIQGLEITEGMFPPIIKKLLKGIQDDGRKRALNILLSFYRSLEFPQDYILEKIEEWNGKNKLPLKQGYIKAQTEWHAKNKRLPPNYDKPIYKEFGINHPPEPGMKNPINYTIKKAMRAKGKAEYNKQ
jgi:ribosomal protein L37AE/L43A